MGRRDSRGIVSNIKNQQLLFARRAALVEAATDIFVKRGFDAVSVNEIAEEAGISVGSLYKYVRTKEDILWLVLDFIYSNVENALETNFEQVDDPKRRLADGLDQYLHVVNSVREGVLLMYREWPHLPKEARRDFMERERKLMARFVSIVEEGAEAGVFDVKDAYLAALNIMMTGRTWVLKSWLMEDGIEDYIKRQTKLIMRMLGAQEAYSRRPARRNVARVK